MTLLFAFPEQMALGKAMGLEPGAWEWRHFPDGEPSVRVQSEVRDKPVAVLCSLNQPDSKALAVIFLSRLKACLIR